jgi:hypothetical protein
LVAARRLFGIPDFRYYALADGIRKLLEGVRRPLLARVGAGPPELQTSFFNT